MVALDSTALLGRAGLSRLKWNLGPLVAGSALIAALLVLAAILSQGFGENGFRLGSRWAWRYDFFLFFVALVAGPLRRLVHHVAPRLAPPENLSRKLVWSFCASYGVYLLSVFLPNVIELSAGAALMVVFGGSVVLVMALTVAPLARLGRPALIPEKIRRSLLGTAAAYFWLCYCLMALARISGPHRPDDFYGISLCLMVAALLVRYADQWFGRGHIASKPV